SVTASIAGSATTTATTTVTVNNVAPGVAKIGDPHQIDEGTTISRTVAFTDPGTKDQWTYTVIWGDGTTQGPTTTTSKSFVISHTYADNGNYNATVIVDDDDTGEGTSSFSVKVNNVDPLLDALSNLVVNTGSTSTITPTFTDPGFTAGSTPETFTYSINWGDSTPDTTGSVTNVTNGSPGVLTSGSFTGSHSYSTAGTYTV